jgi:chemotaxis methyl-accepting protein methylase
MPVVKTFHFWVVSAKNSLLSVKISRFDCLFQTKYRGEVEVVLCRNMIIVYPVF